MLPVILGFTPNIQVDAHLDDNTQVATAVMYIVHLHTCMQ